MESSEVLELATFIRTQCPHLKFSGLMTIGQIGRVSSDQDPNPDFKASVSQI